MRDLRTGPVAGAAGILALIAAALTLFSPAKPELTERLKTYFTSTNELAAPDRLKNVDKQIEELEGFEKDADFSRLPSDRQTAVRDRLAELKAYQAYAERVATIEKPTSVTSDAKLKEIHDQLAAVKIPAEYVVAWNQSEAVEQQRQLLADSEALERTVNEVERSYRRLASDAAELRRTSDAADLPGRARKLLKEAEAVPAPVASRDKPIPGSSTVTYATVFRFERVQKAVSDWETARSFVEKAAKVGS
jgi:hypothetical protein